jgi:hypothetical protein
VGDLPGLSSALARACRRTVAVACVLLVAACTTSLPKVDDPWDLYDVRVIDRQVRFELPARAALYGAPKPSQPEVSDEGFVSLVFAGYGYDRRSGYGSRVHLTIHVKQYMDGPQGEPTPERLRRAVLTRSDYLERRAGREPPTRPVEFETLSIGGRSWELIEHEPGFSLITFFDDRHYLTMVMSTSPKFEATRDQRAQLKAVMLEMAARIEIGPAE